MNDYSDKEKNLNKTGTFRPLVNHIGLQLEPVIRKKSGFDVKLLENWPQIVGAQLASLCTPVKVRKTRSSADAQAKAATLMIECDGFASLKIQHQADEIIEKINHFLGFHAIDKIKIVQKSRRHATAIDSPTRALSQHEMAWIEQQTNLIEDEALRASMKQLGENIIEAMPHALKNPT